MLARTSGQSGDGDELSVCAAGFSLDRSFLDELAVVDLQKATPIGSPACFVVEREELPPEDKLVARFNELGFATERSCPGGFLAGMIPDPHLTELPRAAIREIDEWMVAKSQIPSAAKHPARISTRPIMCSNDWTGYDPAAGKPIREWCLNCDETDGLFGIVTEPADHATLDGRCIVLLNSGSVRARIPSFTFEWRTPKPR